MVCHQIRLRGDDSFSYWLKKKAEDIFCPHMWAWIFRVKSSIATMNLLAQIICYDLINFLHLLSCRWFY